MSKNLYYLQTRSGYSYNRSTREKVNALIEKGGAEWIGTDYDEDRDEFVHYADRIFE
jgi:hypothetical protein